MDDLLATVELNQLKTGDVIEGKIISVKKHEVWIDLGAHGVGVVMRREIGHGQALEEGQPVTTSVVDQRSNPTELRAPYLARIAATM